MAQKQELKSVANVPPLLVSVIVMGIYSMFEILFLMHALVSAEYSRIAAAFFGVAGTIVMVGVHYHVESKGLSMERVYAKYLLMASAVKVAAMVCMLALATNSPMDGAGTELFNQAQYWLSLVSFGTFLATMVFCVVTDFNFRDYVLDEEVDSIALESKNRLDGCRGGQRVLDLSNLYSPTIPIETWQFNHIWVLHLEGNALREIPEEIARLNLLVTLIVHDNRLESLPEEVCSLTKLREFGANRNCIFTLPRNLKKLESLEVLQLSKNKLDCVPREVGDIASLKDLRVDHNMIGQVDQSILNLKNLESFDISFNSLENFPEELLKMSQIRDICFGGNGASAGMRSMTGLSSDLWGGTASFALPDKFEELVELNNLILSNLGLTTLPATICGLEKLICLDLRSNSLASLPDNLASLVSLEVLKLDDNRLKELPLAIAKLKCLESLAASGNEITEVPQEICSLELLESLDVTNNPVKKPPVEVCDGGLEAIILFFKPADE